MGRTLDRDLQELAAWLENADQVDPGLRQTFSGALSTLRMDTALRPSGSDADPSTAALEFLLSIGRVQPEDVDALLSQAHPEGRFARNTWRDQEAQANALAASDAAIESEGLVDAPTPADLAALAVGQGITQARPGEDSAITASPLPDTYSRASVEAALRQITDQVREEVEGLRKLQRVVFPNASVPGQAVAPGTLPISALNPVQAHEIFNRIPGPEQTIELEIGSAPDIDTFIVDGSAKGPGRVRSVTATYPPDWRPHAGPQRYRVLRPDMFFGVMWLQFETDGWTASPANYLDLLQTRYGAVLASIPHSLGRIPTGLRLATFGPDAPSSLGYRFEDAAHPLAWSGPDQLWETRAELEFHTAGKPPWGIRGSGTAITPTAAAIIRIGGVSVSLVTGTTAEEVWQQLNTRRPIAGAMIDMTGRGPTITSPGGLEAASPCGPSVITWNGLTGGAELYNHRTQSYNLGAEGRMVQGVPFRYEDCARLVATDRQFSLIVMPVFGEGSVISGTWPSPAHWTEHGLTTPRAQRRNWGVDAIIE